MEINNLNPPIQHVNNRYKLWIIVVIVLIALSVGGIGGYMLGTKQNNDTKTVTPTSSPSPTIIFEPTPTLPEQAKTLVKLADAWNLGVKTFSDPKINITFDYPSYFQTRVLDIEKVNKEAKERADKYNQKPYVYDQAFDASFSTPEIDPVYYTGDRQLRCDNTIGIGVTQYDNPQNMALYDFIDYLDKHAFAQSGPAAMAIRDKVTQSQLPKAGSYVYEAIYGEAGITKIVFFTNKDKVYEFNLNGGCDLGDPYTQDGENVFDNMLKSVKFL